MIQSKKQPCGNPTKDLLDEKLVAKAFWECLKENNPDGVIEIVNAHISAKRKSRCDLSPLRYALKNKNPTIRTLAKFVHENA